MMQNRLSAKTSPPRDKPLNMLMNSWPPSHGCDLGFETGRKRDPKSPLCQRTRSIGFDVRRNDAGTSADREMTKKYGCHSRTEFTIGRSQPPGRLRCADG